MRTSRLRSLIAALAVTGWACSGSPDKATEPEEWAPPNVISFVAQTPAGFETECMEDVVETVDGSTAVPLNCTANDLNLFFTIPGQGQDPPLCLAGEPIAGTLDIEAHFAAGANERWDVGLWIRDDNLPIPNALRGDCRHWSLVPVSDAETVGDTRVAPFFDADGDTCGDLQQDVETILPITLSNILCQDTDGDGQLDIGACVSYDNNGNQDHSCTDAALAPAQTRPNTKAKCACGPLNIPVNIAGKIIVEKQTIPDGDTQDFTFTGDLAGAISDGETIELVVEAGTYTTTETVPSGWDLTSIVCTDSDAEGDDSSGNLGTATATFEVSQGETVTCVFTNTKKGSITIEKQTLPNGDTQEFTFTGDVSGTLSDGETASQEVSAGTYSSTETVPAGWDLTSIVCDDANSTGNTGTGVATFIVAAGESVKCVFTNTKDGSITIEKQTIPDGNTTDFTFTGDVAGTLSDGETATESVAPGTYTSTETVPAGWDLTSIVCDDANSTGSGAVATFRVEAGESVKCVFTNTKRATVQVNKRQSGALPAAGAFEFQIRFGATTLSSGTVIATGTNDAAGVVTFACNGGDPTKCTNVSGIAQFVPGDYQLCEVNMAPGWANNIDGFTPNGEAPEGDDNGNECVDIELGAGDSGVPSVPEGDPAIPDPIDNTPPPGGDARTIGYWKNHSCLANGNQEDVLSTYLPIQLTDTWLIDDCETVVYLLDKRDLTTKHTKQSSDAAYGLAAQLAAALLNVNATAATCPVPTATIDLAQTLLADIGFDGTGSFLGPKVKGAALTQRNLALSYAAILDDWNNNDCP